MTGGAPDRPEQPDGGPGHLEADTGHGDHGPSEWSFHHADRVRFGDLDAMGHLNNVAFLQFFESARIAFLGQLLPEHDPTDPSDFGLIFAECHINYRAPAFFDEEIRTSVRPGATARSSFRVEFAMHSGPGPRGERLLAEGYGVLVGYEYAAGRAAQLPPALIEALESARV